MVIRKGYKQTELGIIPEDWNYLNMVDVVRKNDSIKIGPFGSQLKKELLVTSGYKVYGQENIFEKNFDIGNRYINVNHFLKLKTCEIVSGDFIISMMGTIGQCMIVPNNIERGIMDSHLIRIRLKLDLISNDFFIYLFQSKIILNQIMKLSVGSIMAGLSSSIIKKLIIPVPTISEQKKIVNTLSEIDELINSQESLIQKKKNIKQGAMQELLTGKRRLEGFSGEWESKTLDKVANFFSGGTPLTSISEYYGGEIPWIVSGDLNSRFIIEVNGRITEKGLNNSSAKMVKENTLLIALYGATAGVVAISLIRASINQAVLAIIPCSIDTKFLFYKLEFLKDWIITTYTQGGQPNLSANIIKSIKMEFPSEDEQEAISKILSDMDSEIEQLESQKEKYINLKQAMMQKLLTGEIRLV